MEKRFGYDQPLYAAGNRTRVKTFGRVGEELGPILEVSHTEDGFNDSGSWVPGGVSVAISGQKHVKESERTDALVRQ